MRFSIRKRLTFLITVVFLCIFSFLLFAGAVALLLHSDPKLTPTTIKTALMISALDLGVSSYIQGQ